MKRLLPLLCFSLLLISCDKEKIDSATPAAPKTWEMHQDFLHFNKFITSLHAHNDDLYVLERTRFSRISHSESEEEVWHYRQDLRNLTDHQSPINSSVFVGADGDYLRVVPNHNPVTAHTSVKLHMKEADPGFKGFNLLYSNSSASFGLSPNNVVLVPYFGPVANHPNGSGSGAKLLLVKIGTEPYLGNDRLSVIDTKVVDFLMRSHVLSYIKCVDNHFYVSTDHGVIRISEDGEVKQLLPDQIVVSIFKHKSNTYAVTYNGPSRTRSLFRSTTGKDWIKVADFEDVFERLSYHEISDELLLASYNSQLFQIEFAEGLINVKELDNAGLEGNYITSIAKVKGRVYVSTQSGIFHKEEEQLLTYKE